MEKFLEQSLEAEENFYRLEEQRLQAEDLRRETEHTRELHMLQMLGQMFAGLTKPMTTPSPASQPTRNSQTGHSIHPPSRPFFGNNTNQASEAEYANSSQQTAPGLLKTEDGIHY